MKKTMRKLIAAVAVLSVFLTASAGGCSLLQALNYPSPKYEKEVEVIDAFCIPDEPSYFCFYFTLKNLRAEDTELSYEWTLNDPMADNPGAHEGINDPAARIYEGQGTVSLPAAESLEINIKIDETREYDPEFYIMYVSVYRDGELVGYYRDQKSSYDWDYSTTPPVRIK